ncbi:suprabasin isoform X4 [Acomys russatus]|uniref:suprabasin isoform X4 n=1 Tax=Acomys russatus TaxID=60746 RepID=UPI0021E2EAB1|nr:suprabasin isoform X4 [Acomys russatus]
MLLANLLRSCCLLLLLGALPSRATKEDPIEKVIEGFSRGLSTAEREVGKALQGINNGITQAGREVERVFNGLSSMGAQAGTEMERGLDKGTRPGVYGGQHGGAASTTAVSGASVNKPFINFPALWRSIAAIMP